MTTGTPEKTVTRKAVMLAAADLIEKDDGYTFMSVGIPHTCKDSACVLGWVGYVAGVDPYEYIVENQTRIARAACFLGYEGEYPPQPFYDAMDRVEDSHFGDLPIAKSWRRNRSTAAANLRSLAEEL